MALRCPGCRSRRASFASMLAHVEASGHALCPCGGYHYPHRPGSPYCIQNPLSALHEASRHGADDADLLRAARHIIEQTPEAASKVRDLLTHWRIHEDV